MNSQKVLQKRINQLVKIYIKTFESNEKEARAQVMENIKEEMGDDESMERSIGVMEQNVRDGLLSV